MMWVFRGRNKKGFNGYRRYLCGLGVGASLLLLVLLSILLRVLLFLLSVWLCRNR